MERVDSPVSNIAPPLGGVNLLTPEENRTLAGVDNNFRPAFNGTYILRK